MTTTQLGLPLGAPAPRYAEADLLPNSAQDEARAWLNRTADWPGARLILWGAPGCGKTHLLHAWAQRNQATILTEAPTTWPETPVAIDSLDTVPDEPALFHLLNATAEARHPLLMIATEAPARLPVRLPDLSSRLKAALAVQIGPAPEAFLARLLEKLLADRQFSIPLNVQTFLLRRLPRSPGAIRDAAARLDAAALAAGRKIDFALASEALGLGTI